MNKVKYIIKKISEVRLDSFDPGIMSLETLRGLVRHVKGYYRLRGFYHKTPEQLIREFSRITLRLQINNVIRLPSRLQIFRGVRIGLKDAIDILSGRSFSFKKSNYGESWTVDIEIARDFSIPKRNPVGLVFSDIVSPEEVALYLGKEFVNWVIEYARRNLGGVESLEGLPLTWLNLQGEVLLRVPDVGSFRLCNNIPDLFIHRSVLRENEKVLLALRQHIPGFVPPIIGTTVGGRSYSDILQFNCTGNELKFMFNGRPITMRNRGITINH